MSKSIGMFRPTQISDPRFVEAHAKKHADVDIKLDDGNIITLPIQCSILNGFLWGVLMDFNKKIDIDHVYFPDRNEDKTTGDITYSFTSDTIHKHLCGIYNELILKYNIEPYLDVVASVFKCLARFSMFADTYTRQYQMTLDAISLAELCDQKEVKAIIDRKIDGSHGTKYAEKQFEQMTSDLMKLLANPTALEHNPLLQFMLTKLLKRNQVPQMFGAYGPRSDIDDTMEPHVISESAWSGLKSIEDYATETLSAKKAAFFNNSVIRNAQYFARRCRLGATVMSKIYRGSCGSEVTIPFVIHKEFKKNFIGKFVRVDETTKHLLKDRKWPQFPKDNSVELTKDNIDLFVDREIQMWSPFGCKHTDGVCEHCAGYMHQKLHAYIPDGVWPGVFFTTTVVSSVTQKILSAKHLIKTTSKEFILPQPTQKYLVKEADALLWTKQAAKSLKNKKIFVRVEHESFQGPLGDLSRKVLPSGSTFTKFARLAFADESGHVFDVIDVTDGTTYPYLSNYAMHYLSTIYKRIKVDQDYVDIPMDEFDFSNAFMKYTAVNDDMVSYVGRVDKFVMNDVRNHTGIQECLDTFSRLIWDKSEVSIFPIEMMLRCYLASPDSLEIPVIKDPKEPVRFIGLGEVISNAALSTKLAFQGINAFFEDPNPTLRGIGGGTGFYDALFSFSRID